MQFYKLNQYIHKLLHYEYWSSYVLYGLLAPVLVWNAFRAKSLTYVTLINPNWNNGGLFGESKKTILDLIPEKFKPQTFLISASQKNSFPSLSFPLIAKPIFGERGKGVCKIEDFSDLIKYHKSAENDYITQEFIDYKIELGVFYSRKPSEEKGKISSVTMKEFLHIIGDGKSTFNELILKNIRALFLFNYLKQKFAKHWNDILPNGEKFELEGIGNHSRGTKFINANHLINNQLENVFENISRNIDGFQYGRFDIRVPSFEDLYAGKNIKIMELNGANSEPTHIYDTSIGFFQAYYDLAWHWLRMTDIAIENQKNGYKSKNLWLFLNELKAYKKLQNK